MFTKKIINKKSLIFAAITLIVLLGLIRGGYYWWTGTPQYSIGQIKKAAATHNPDLGLKYIDTDAIFENLWTDMKGELLKESEKTGEFVAFGMMLGIQMAESMKPRFKEQFQETIKNSFLAQSEEESKNSTITKQKSALSDIWQQKDLKIKKQGNFAYINLPDNIQIVLSRQTGKRYWVISKIAGLMGNLLPEENKLEQPVTSISEPTPITRKFAPTELPTTVKPKIIPHLTSIYVSNVWKNWNANAEKDGPVFTISYLDEMADPIYSHGDIEVNTDIEPISADVEIYTAVDLFPPKKGRLVYSGFFTNDQIIKSSPFPELRIPKEQINVNPETDTKYGIAVITLHTPEQGDFSAEDDMLYLYQ